MRRVISKYHITTLHHLTNSKPIIIAYRYLKIAIRRFDIDSTNLRPFAPKMDILLKISIISRQQLFLKKQDTT
jgi:hypothetical protein